MEGCVFCKIIAGELPCYKTYEDDLFLAFLDMRPLNPGNSLLIPKKHYRWVDDIDEFGKYWETAHKISTATKVVVRSMSTTYLTLGFEVPHAHIRIIPRFENDGHVDGIRLSAIKNVSREEMTRLAKKILKQAQSHSS